MIGMAIRKMDGLPIVKHMGIFGRQEPSMENNSYFSELFLTNPTTDVA
jgi:hypothetical protein